MLPDKSTCVGRRPLGLTVVLVLGKSEPLWGEEVTHYHHQEGRPGMHKVILALVLPWLLYASPHVQTKVRDYLTYFFPQAPCTVPGT